MMNTLKLFSIKSVAIALTIGSLTMTGNAQAHHQDELLSLAPFIIYNVLARPHYYSEHRYIRHHKQKRQHHQKPRRRSHSHDGYSNRRINKNHHRH